ncbi:MAG: 6-bladed beta-propeller [Gammaproteobacteria bacterium]|nr:6-bladed beta-propeller [Gammaproteobacteria bacterium]MDH5729245.1 6-bladed beta-propeller [Gammaproteobacteria bacterium]
MDKLHLLVVVLILLLGACSNQPKKLVYHTTTEQKLWPQAPDEPRFVFVGQLTGENNFYALAPEKNYLKKFAFWLVGLVAGEIEIELLHRPQTGIVDGDGRVYVSDVGRRGLVVFDPIKGRLQVWQQATAMKTFITPIGVVKIGNDLFVADADLAMVVRLNNKGEPQASIGYGQLERPTGLAFDETSQHLYVADSKSHQIKIFNLAGDLVDTIGQKGSHAGEFNGPTFITIANQQLYVADSLNARIQILDLGGKPIRQFGRRGKYIGDMPQPKGLAVDANGLIYVIESFFDHILVFNQKGEFLLPIGGHGQQAGLFNHPSGVWTGKNNLIYVADMMNSRVQSFQYLNKQQNEGM